MTSLHSTGKFYVAAGEKRRQWSYLEFDPAWCNVDLPGQIPLLLQSWHDCSGVTNHFLIGFDACCVGAYPCLLL